MNVRGDTLVSPTPKINKRKTNKDNAMDATILALRFKIIENEKVGAHLLTKRVLLEGLLRFSLNGLSFMDVIGYKGVAPSIKFRIPVKSPYWPCHLLRTNS
jgi:hypothetical protein